MAESKLAAAMKEAKPTRGGKPLLVDAILAQLKPLDRKEVDAALRDPERVSAMHLAEILTDNGHAIGRAAVLTWRRRYLK